MFFTFYMNLRLPNYSHLLSMYINYEINCKHSLNETFYFCVVIALLH